MTHFQLKNMYQCKSSKNYRSIDTLGSNTIVTNSIVNPHELLNIKSRSTSHQYKHRSTNHIITLDKHHSKSFYKNQQNYHSTSNLPPLSPPPLSPTNMSFSNTSKPAWRQRVHSSATYYRASSISSSDDDDEPLGLFLKESLLTDQTDEDDDDLVPIATLSTSRNNSHHLSAAEKYKAKVRARLDMKP